ncbi:hypothetical protein JCM8547_008416 [Rhodosporidiobolus lusitaniae]
MATATTPNAQRNALQATNTRSHSVRTAQQHANTRPAPPGFYDERAFLNALGQGGYAPVAGPSNPKPATATRAAFGQGGAGVGNARKRTAGEVIDPDSHSPDQLLVDAAPAAKKVKATAAGAAVDPNVKRKARKADRAQREKGAQEMAQWRAKYKKAFPSFTFYFDAIDEATKAQLSLQVRKLGASIDNFFSKKVTHVVTTRPVPSGGNKENVDSPGLKDARGMADSAAGKTRKQSTRSPKMHSLMNGQKLRPVTGDIEKNPFIDSQDILSKALDFGLKIWRADKLQLIVTRMNSHSPNKIDPSLQRNPSLPTLLRDEQLYGTRERDPFVPRKDMHYFPPHKYFFLVEDSNGEHRPIVAKEYSGGTKHEDAEWPILHGGIEGRSGFYRYDGEITYERRIPPPAQAVQEDAPVASTSKISSRPLPPNLRRAVSLQNVARGSAAVAGAIGAGPAHHNHHDPRDSYIAASGNSQIITSNLGTTTSNAGVRSGAAAASRFAAGQGPFLDKRLAVLSNRTVSVAGGALLGSAGTLASGGSAAGSGKLQPAASVSSVKSSAGGRLGALKRQGKLTRSMSVESGLLTAAGSRKAMLMNPPPVLREEPKKPGYCENCRLKYEDFKDHVVSSKHRRFALNLKNWVELDCLLSQIARPLLPTSIDPNDTQIRHHPQSLSSEDIALAEDSGFFDATVLPDAERKGDDNEGEDSEMSEESSAQEESSEQSSSEEEEGEEEEEAY